MSKAIDRKLCIEAGTHTDGPDHTCGRPILDTISDRWAGKGSVLQRSTQAEAESVNITAPATAEAQQWAGYGTSMKPGHEPICVARKPLGEGTVAGNVLRWGTGAINIDAMRIGVDPNDPNIRADASRSGTATSIGNGTVYMGGEVGRGPSLQHAQGRWPANVALDSETAAALDQTTGETSYNPPGKFGVQRTDANDTATVKYQTRKDGDGIFGYGDRGGPSRYFYTAKAPADERITIDGVSHVTVKPLDLMRWLVRGYAGPKGALILDPFAGSGTTGEAAIAEGMRVVLIEQDETYLPLIKARVTRRTDPVEHLRTVGEDLGLFGLDEVGG